MTAPADEDGQGTTERFRQELEIFANMPLKEGPEHRTLQWIKARSVAALSASREGDGGLMLETTADERKPPADMETDNCPCWQCRFRRDLSRALSRSPDGWRATLERIIWLYVDPTDVAPEFDAPIAEAIANVNARDVALPEPPSKNEQGT